MALLSGAAALALAACTGDDGPGPLSKSMALSPKTLALIQEKQMEATSPIVVRIFKEESELEVWKETTSGDYALLKTYPICRWSGELGPKVREGDRQAPEGFYAITPGQMNPNSQYYLAFDLGFPNAYDKALGRYGSNLMVHGDCSSRGCYAMTDEQIQELFTLGRESFKGGQRSFQVQAYPFRMTADNMVRHRNNPNLAFWKMLKEGSDTFEVTRAPPKVDYCGKRYVFNATPVNAGQKFQASAACPEYTQPEGLADAIAARQQDLATRIASADASAPVAPVKTGKDGGMHKVFLAKLANPELTAPGSLPPVVKPPGSDYGVATNAPAPEDTIALATADMVPAATDVAASMGGQSVAGVPMPAPRPTDIPGDQGTQLAAAPGNGVVSARSPAVTAPGTQVAALDSGGGGFLDSVKGWFGGGSTTPAAAPAAASAPQASSGASALANAGFSFSSLFGGGSAAPAPAAAAPVADVPVPPVRPPVPQQMATRTPAGASPAAHPSTIPAAQPARVPAPAAVQPSAAPAQTGYAPVPTPGQATYTSVPTPTAAAAASGAAAQLRPSMPASGQQEAGALPGAPILTPGTFSSSVQ
ncbi:L,D-transpeptidase family protein [Ancylobacter sp. VNQ12]|uniref:L,D-transpeptidase family protein n=1 Tax=Ancylobacter sp. VNQ12 TaxID=3400920 RepID=UPI003C093631